MEQRLDCCLRSANYHLIPGSSRDQQPVPVEIDLVPLKVVFRTLIRPQDLQSLTHHHPAKVACQALGSMNVMKSHQ